MAGIGFVLQKLSQEDNLLGPFRAFCHSAMLAAGPWIITIVAMSMLMMSDGAGSSHYNLEQYQLIMMYNFAFSLVISSPVSIGVTRYIADALYDRNPSVLPETIVGGLCCLLTLLLPVGITLYYFVLGVTSTLAYLAVINFLLIGSVWFLSVFLSTLRDYLTISFSFLLGFTPTILVKFLVSDNMGYDHDATLLCSLNVGLALTLAVIVWRLMSAFPYPVRNPFGFFPSIKQYWELPVGALAFNLGAWIDKWILWFSHEGVVSPGGFLSYPPYDSAMFLANLSVIPVLSIFAFSIETRFYEHCRNYQRSIIEHSSLEVIKERHKSIISIAFLAARNLFIIHGSIALLLIFSAPAIFEALRLPFIEVSMFRFGVIGSLFLASILFTTIFLSYFDARRHAMKVQLVFLVLNALGAYVTLHLGRSYYGYGFTLAALLTSIFGVAVLGSLLHNLPFYTFVKNNAALKLKRRIVITAKAV